ncbi:branched-chain amino acid ABC transporter permease [Lentzea sp. NPDC051213]|uniref:branched-chain amino acid ABC transporter permease n=1 Tax=Lentzea sp. NPDC051213 TaxID=3364126 RepID=UPI0037A8239D
MITFLQSLVFGLLVGGVYALASSGLSLIFGVMRIVNLAHGGLMVAAAFLTYTIWDSTGLDPFLAIPLVCTVLFAVGCVLYQGVMRFAWRGGEASIILATLALAMIIEGVLALVWGAEPHNVTPSYVNSAFRVGPIVFPTVQAIGFVVACVLLGALYLLLNGTWLGRGVRAAAANPTGATLTGIRVERVNVATYAIGVALTGAAGSIVAVLAPFTPDSGDRWIGIGLAIVVLGGMGSLAGGLAGALLFGIAETMTTTYLSTAWATAVPFVVIIVVLLVRPQGIFGRAVRRDVMAV